MGTAKNNPESAEGSLEPKKGSSKVENSLTPRSLKKIEKSSDDRMDGLINRLSACWKQADEAPDYIRPVAFITTLLLVTWILAGYIAISIQELKLLAPELRPQLKKTFNWIFALFACALVLWGGHSVYVSHRFDQPHDRPVPIQDKGQR